MRRRRVFGGFQCGTEWGCGEPVAAVNIARGLW